MLDDDLRAVRRAAELLRDARRVLISTGAGMSAECGIPTYRDKGGLWRRFEPFASRGLSPAEIAHVPALRAQPERAWAFHEWMRRAIARAEPHDGYAVVTRWVLGELPDAFVLTTNVDGLHLRAGVPEVRLCERYGSHWELQCLAPCGAHAWADRRPSLCALDLDALVASGWPRCPFCDGTARPRVLLDHDDGFVERAVDLQRYERFLAAGQPDVLIVVGTTLWFSWPDEVAARPRVVHINPDPATHARYDDAVAITMGARDALVGIDWMLRQLRRGAA